MTFWTDRRVVITGAEGFIGSTPTDLLVDAGADVTAFAHYKPYGEHGFIADHVQAGRVNVVAGDIRASRPGPGRRRWRRHRVPPRQADRDPVQLRGPRLLRPGQRRRHPQRRRRGPPGPGAP